jgi:N-acetylneuraminic acid mutarotase
VEAVSWSDASGNLWLFGGDGIYSDGQGLQSGELNDLWKFDPSSGATGEWTWMGGSMGGNPPGVYGTLGTAAPTNLPGGRVDAVTWSDASGNLWLFGGDGYVSNGSVGLLNDLWKYKP